MKAILFILLLFCSLKSTAQQNLYFVGDANNNWESGQWNWAESSGGLPVNLLYPGVTDTAIFDVNSPSAISGVSSMNCAKIDMTGYTGVFTLTGDDLTVSGNIVLSDASTTAWGSSGTTYKVIVDAACNYTSAGCTMGASVIVSGGSITVVDSFITLDENYLRIESAGVFDCTDKPMKIGTFITDASALTFSIGTATCRVIGHDGLSPYGTTWDIGDGVNNYIDVSLGTIRFEGAGSSITFSADAALASSNYYYNNLEFVNGSSTTYYFLAGGDGTLYYTNFDYTGTTCTFSFDAGCIFIGDIDLSGSGGNLTVVTGAGGSATLSLGTPLCWNYVNLTNITASIASYAGCNSINGGGNTNWTFNNCGAACPTANTKKSYGFIIGN